MKKIAVAFLLIVFVSACTISYKFNGASINYDETPSIDIKEFQNQAPLVYLPLAQTFNENLKDFFTRNTKLQFTNVNPALELEGEIVRYDLTPLAVQEDNFSSQTRLTLAISYRYRNNKNPQEDKEETISAYRDFSSSLTLDEVQDGLIQELTKDIIDQIFNSTMSNW